MELLKLRRLILSAWLFLAAIICARGEGPMPTAVFSPRFRTLQIENGDDFMGLPVIRFGSDDRLIVTFDELGSDLSYLQYRLVHCNADWRRSQLVESEFVDGFNIEDITDYGFSSNTYVHYVNYRIEVPGSRLRLLRSGNYVLQVFPQEDPEDLLLQVRFCVSEDILSIGGEATSRTDRGLNTEWQQVNVSIGLGDSGLRSPMTDLLLVVNQNGSEAYTRRVARPQRMSGKSLIYEHITDLIFPAGNEYRRFETVRANYPGMGVDSVGYGERNYHAWIRDAARRETSYIYDRTQNGRFKIDEYNSTDADLGADYVTVHFELDHPQIIGADVYLDGDFVGSGRKSLGKMDYDSSRGRYIAEIPLKQGSYNYRYVVRSGKDGEKMDASYIEGDKYETRNEYQVFVYLCEPGSRGDRLLAAKQLYVR